MTDDMSLRRSSPEFEAAASMIREDLYMVQSRIAHSFAQDEHVNLGGLPPLAKTKDWRVVRNALRSPEWITLTQARHAYLWARDTWKNDYTVDTVDLANAFWVIERGRLLLGHPDWQAVRHHRAGDVPEPEVKLRTDYF